MSKIYRALCISGGGAKGAWAGGLVHQMINERNYDWDFYVGTSTGALLNLLIPMREMDKLKSFYTSVTNKDIFSVDPFTKKGKINPINAIKRIILGKTSLGESNNLFNLIKNNYTQTDFKYTKKLGKMVYACVANYTYNKVDFIDNIIYKYEDFIRGVWASTSVPIATDLVKIKDSLYLDGGVLMHVPVQRAIDLGADEIDVIVLRPEKYNIDDKWEGKNMFDVILRTIKMMQDYISDANVLIGMLSAKHKDVKLRIRYVPFSLTDNSLMFDKDTMIKWWEEGYEYGRIENQSIKYYIKTNGSFELISNQNKNNDKIKF